MAIDFGGYAGAYAGAGGGQMGGQGGGANMFAQGLSQSLANIPTVAERLENDQVKYFSKLQSQLSPVFTIDPETSALKDVTPGGIQAQNLQTLPEAWADYKKTIGNRIRPNEFSLFAEKYDKLMTTSGKKLIDRFAYMSEHGVKNSTIREYLREPGNQGMRDTLVKLGYANPEYMATISPYLSEGIGIMPGALEKSGDLAWAASPTLTRAAFQGAGAMYKGGIGAGAKGALKGLIPGESIFKLLQSGQINQSKALKMLQSNQAQMRSGRATNFGKSLEKSMRKSTAIAEDAVKSAQSAKNKASKKYKGKKFSTSKAGKDAKAAVDLAKAKVKTMKSRPAQSGMKVISRYISRHGKSGLIKAIARKVGPMGAAKLIGKLGLSAGMKAGGLFTAGVTTVASLAIDLWTIAQVATILKDIAKEEAGGFRAPRKMLFGGDETGLEGTTF